MKSRIFIIVVAIIFFFLTIKGIAGNPDVPQILNDLFPVTGALENGPELGRYMHTYALANNHTYALTREMVDVGPDYGYFRGNFFAFFAPGVSYLALPAYLLGQKFNLALLFTFAFVGLISILNLLLIYQICRKIFLLPNWASILSTIIFAFGSTALSYEVVLYQHPFTLFFILSSFYAIWRYRQQGRYGFVWAIIVWVNYGLAIFVDYPNAILLLPIMVYFLFSAISVKSNTSSFQFGFRISFFVTSIFFVGIMFLHGYHNLTYFDSYTNISGNIPSIKSLRQAGVLDLPNLDEYIATKLPKKDVPSLLKETILVSSFNTLFFTTDKGLLIFSPILLLAFWAIFTLRNKLSLEHLVLLGLLLTNIGFYSSWGDPWGGWAFGPRYLVPSMAILSIFICIWIANSKSIIPKLILLLLFIYSSAVALLGALTTNQVRPRVEDPEGIYHTYLFNLRLLKTNKGSSFVYNTYLANKISLVEYYVILYVLLLLIFIAILFIVPRFDKHEPDHINQ